VKDDQILDSWKEITAYLRRSRKTCIRWEKELGLPVHRYEDSPKARVFAYKDEIDLWRKKTQHSDKKLFIRKFTSKRLFIPVFAITAAILIGVILTGFFVLQRRHDSIDSIAVLPFKDMNPGRDTEYLAEGIPETLINALNRIEGLHVSGKTSSFFFKGEQDIQKIGRRLGVDALLEGSIQTSGNNLRVMVRLININNGFQIWSEDYHRTIDDVFAVQDDITQSVVKALKVKFQSEKEGLLVKTSTSNSEAFNFYLQGLSLLRRHTESDLYQAVALFQKALQEDPSFVHAYTGLAESYINLLGLAVRPDSDLLTQAESATMEAIKLDESLAEAHSALGVIMAYFRWSWADAEQEFKHALQLNPRSVSVRLAYSRYLRDLGRYEEAYKLGEKAQERDPLSIDVAYQLVMNMANLGQHNKALEHLLNFLEIYPESSFLHWTLALLHLEMGNFEKGIQTLHEQIKLMEGENISDEIGMLAYAFARWGNREKAEEYLQQLFSYAEQHYVSPTIFAIVHGALGNLDEAIKWLERAYDLHDYRLAYARFFWYDPIRKDPRFSELMKKIGLEK